MIAHLKQPKHFIRLRSFTIKILLIFSFTYLSSSCNAKKNINGTYNYLGTYLDIRKDSFYVRVPSFVNTNFPDTLCTGIIKKINNNFIELNSADDNYYSVAKTMQIEQSLDPMHNDSIKIEFSIGFDVHPIDIIIKTDKKDYAFKYSEEIKSIYIPNIVKQFSFSIRNNEYPTANAMGNTYSKIEFANKGKVEIKEDVNIVFISIPSVNNNFFYKEVIRGEYLRILNNKLIWRGNKLRKEK